MAEPKYESPEFIEMASGDGRAYVPFEEAVSNPELSAQIVAEAVGEADGWSRRYAAFFERIGEQEPLQVVEAIERVMESIARKSGERLDGLDIAD